MQAQDLLKYVQKLDLGGKLPQLCHLTLSTKPYQEADEVKKAVKAFQPEEGWFCFQDRITHFKAGEMPDHGVILYGEIKSSDKTLHIQANNNSGWLLTTYQEEHGETHLVETTQLLGEFENVGNLAYRVYWQHDGEQGYRPICAAFAGFLQKGDRFCLRTRLHRWWRCHVRQVLPQKGT